MTTGDVHAIFSIDIAQGQVFLTDPIDITTAAPTIAIPTAAALTTDPDIALDIATVPTELTAPARITLQVDPDPNPTIEVTC